MSPQHLRVKALLESQWVQDGPHITAVGADGPGKQELDPVIDSRADMIVVDSIAQCSEYGEVSHALSAGLIQLAQPTELGTLLASGKRGRDDSRGNQITVADLTGVAVQDAQIAHSIVDVAA
jgi:ornithine cyclodeaminase